MLVLVSQMGLCVCVRVCRRTEGQRHTHTHVITITTTSKTHLVPPVRHHLLHRAGPPPRPEALRLEGLEGIGHLLLMSVVVVVE